MWRRLKRVAVPVLVVGGGAGLLAFSAMQIDLAKYRRAANQEWAAMIGTAVDDVPEAEIARLMRGLQDGVEDEQRAKGEEILRKYGYTDSDFATKSSANLAGDFAKTFALTLGMVLLALGGYFGWQDWRRARKVRDLVQYLQDLSHKIYDLKLEENTEGELSILANELYKITVLLKEAAENNRKLAENLEAALADISHQLRTPLTSLQIMVDSIYDDPEMPAEVRQDFLRSISQQIETMSGLVSTLLHLARLDNGSLKMQREEVVIVELLERVRQNLAALADLENVAIELSGDLEARVELDARWQGEALTNIVKNALEHSQSGTKVEVKVSDCPLFLRVDIIDTGEGMSLHDQKRIFERFYRAPGSQKNSIGIGLAFAKAVIMADDGQVTVDSKLGEGTKFTVRYFK